MGNCNQKNQGETIDELNQQIRDSIGRTESYLKEINDKSDIYLKNYQQVEKYQEKYIKDFTDFSNNIDVLKKDVTSLTTDITDLTNDLSKIYGNIESQNIINNNYTNKINTQKKHILDKSYSISYFENLLLAAYLQIFDSVNAQNHALENSKGVRANMYSTDNSTFVYQQDRISFYKNLNTGLFFLYYILIVLLVYVILKLNQTTSILVKLTLFRLFVIILILFPLFGLRFERFIYKMFGIFYNRISFSYLLKGNHPPGTGYTPPVQGNTDQTSSSLV